MGMIESLHNAALYDPAPAKVEVVETHMSWVILAGPYVYKIKKPVDLGFADFTTLAKRGHFCQEELRLNQPLAPQLYLAVVAITGNPDAPVVGGSGPPIEYAVQMRQFPQSRLFRRMLREDRLLPTHIDELARTVANFHQDTGKAMPNDRFGTWKAICEPVEANFRELADLVKHDDQIASMRATEQWTRNEFAARRSHFIGRKQAGFVRECHGDMHLGNIVLLDDKAVLFDRIEFNEDFRWIDVMNDLAFPVMDLEHRGRADLAYRLLNAYLEGTADYAGLAVLPYYLVYRALVIAKVAGIRAQQKQGDAGQQRLRTRLSTYLRLAGQYTHHRQPLLMITHGVAGSGKTTGTQELLEKLPALRIRSDVERKRMVGLPPQARSDSPIGEAIYSPEMNHRTYVKLAEMAAAVLGAGFSVIVDAAFLRRADRDMYRRLARQLDVPFAILDFRASTKTLRRRLTLRQDGASEARIAVLDHQLTTEEPLGEEEKPAVIDWDTEELPSPEGFAAQMRDRARILSEQVTEHASISVSAPNMANHRGAASHRASILPARPGSR